MSHRDMPSCRRAANAALLKTFCAVVGVTPRLMEQLRRANEADPYANATALGLVPWTCNVTCVICGAHTVPDGSLTREFFRVTLAPGLTGGPTIWDMRSDDDPPGVRFVQMVRTRDIGDKVCHACVADIFEDMKEEESGHALH